MSFAKSCFARLGKRQRARPACGIGLDPQAGASFRSMGLRKLFGSLLEILDQRQRLIAPRANRRCFRARDIALVG